MKEEIEEILLSEVKFLKLLGFKKDGFDDKSGFWYMKIVKSKMLGKCEILVQVFRDELIITVDTTDKANDASRLDGCFSIIDKKYKRKRLLKILEYLT